MFVLDKATFQEALRASGFTSIGELARSVKIHRNTIHYYLAEKPVLTEGLSKILGAVGLSPAEAFREKTADPHRLEGIAPLVDTLCREFSEVTFVLFGSRTQGRAGRYADWDLGVFHPRELPHSLYRRIVRRSGDLAEDSPFFVDVVNLNHAESGFLRAIAAGWEFAGGSFAGWADLQRKIRA